MWNYFTSKFISIKTPEKKEKPKPKAHNYCLFVSDSSVLSTKFGVFYSSFAPGIKDHKNGILYIAPEEYMLRKVGKWPTAYNARNAILEYYGIEYEYKTDSSYFNDLWFG